MTNYKWPTFGQLTVKCWLIANQLTANMCRLVTYTFTCVTSSFSWFAMFSRATSVLASCSSLWPSFTIMCRTYECSTKARLSFSSECSAQNCETCLMLIWARWANWFPLLGSQFFFQKGPWLIVVLVKFSLLVVLDVSIECIHLYSTGYKKLAQPVTCI